MDSFGERLRYARMRKAITLRELRDSSSVTLATLSRLENDLIESPQMRTVRKLADALDVDAGWLLTGSTVDLPKTLAA